MKIYWSTKSIPELANLDKKQAKQVWRQSSLKALRHWQTWVGILLSACTASAIAVTALKVSLELSFSRDASSFWFWLNLVGIPIIGGSIAGVVGYLVLVQFVIPQARPYMR